MPSPLKDFFARVGARELFLLLVIAIIVNIIGAALTSISHDLAASRGFAIIRSNEAHNNTTTQILMEISQDVNATNQLMLLAQGIEQREVENIERSLESLDRLAGILTNQQIIIGNVSSTSANLDRAIENQQDELNQTLALIEQNHAILKQLAIGVNNSAVAVENQQKEFEMTERLLANQELIIRTLQQQVQQQPQQQQHEESFNSTDVSRR